MLLVLGLAPGIVGGGFFALTNIVPLAVRQNRKDPSALGLPFELLRIRGPTGTVLEGWFLPPTGPRPAPLMVVCHGHLGTMDDFLDEAATLHRAGYAVGMVHTRSHGASDRDVITFGLEEAREVRAMIDQVLARPGTTDRRVGIMGFSMGAVTALRAAYEDPRILAVIADSPFADLREEAFHRVLKVAGPRLANYLWVFVMGYGCLLTGNSPDAWDVRSWVRDLGGRPVMLIHGRDDGNIPPDASRSLAELLPDHGGVWVVPGAGHIQARSVAPEEYRRRVLGFLSRHLPLAPPDGPTAPGP